MIKTLKSFLAAAVFAACLAFITGCESLDSGSNNTQTNVPTHPVGSGGGGGLTTETFHVGDAVEVTFSDLPLIIPPFKERVKPDGTVTLLYNQKFVFAEKNRGDVEAEIRSRYVPAYFNNLTATIEMQDRFYFVNGEVRLPNRYVFVGESTVLKAIASAGGFTDFADKRHVHLTRSSGQRLTVDCKAALESSQQDQPVYAGDQITVDRSIWQ